MALTSMYEPIRQAGRRLIVRSFVFDPVSQKEISAVIEELPSDVIISLKNTPHDYYPTFSANPRVDHAGDHEQWIEFNTMGRYFEWGAGIADLTKDYRRRLSDARQRGASGAALRLDWESLDRYSSFFISNKIDVYTGVALTRDLGTPDQEIYRRFLLEGGWSEGTRCISRRVKWFDNITKKTREVATGAVLVNDCAFLDSSVPPTPLKYVVRLPEEKSPLEDWDPQRQDCTSPGRSPLGPATQEEEEALKKISALCEEAGEYPEGLSHDGMKWSQGRLALSAWYVDTYRCEMEAILLTRYVTETEEQDKGLWQNTLEGIRQALLAVSRMKGEFVQLFREADYEFHVIYTSLDPDRLDCLYRKLNARLSGD